MGRRDELAAAVEELVVVDPAFAGIVVEAAGSRAPARPAPPTVISASCVRAIVFQQLHGRAAATIHGRFDGAVRRHPDARGGARLPVERCARPASRATRPRRSATSPRRCSTGPSSSTG